MAIKLTRWKFIATLGGAVVMWPLTGRAQQPSRVRCILMSTAADDSAFSD